MNNPSFTEFNHVIVACVVDGKLFLMDASDDESEINKLPIYCINGQGLLIDPKFPRWLDLVNKEE